MKEILVFLLVMLFQPLSQAVETLEDLADPEQYEQDILKTIKKIQQLK